VATALFICVLTGIFAGFAPAWQASRLNPVEALRYE
jgi:putative ABC transport system permease protein